MNLNDALSSPLHLKIIIFFNENQASIDTPRGVATWIREERPVVKKALDDLAGLKVLDVYRTSSTSGYGYTTDRKLITKINAHLKKAAK
jgi:hypothetical protein